MGRRTPSRQNRRLRVLVADDEQGIRMLCRLSLEAAGMSVVEAADGEEAVERALAAPPDVAIIDVMMPRLDGWQVAAELRRDPTTRHVSLIFLTALSGEVVTQRARDWEATYVAKPFNPLQLPAIVNDAARRQAC